ncbi:hypothetical protein L7F22_007473 [Adiantum nelumboides]|nr:hypothetical protein [Adiantum nelumboides]
MDGLVDCSSSSSSSSSRFDNEKTILQRKNRQSPHTPHEESEVSSSVVQEDRPERTDILVQNPVLMLSELGCTFEEIGHALSLWGPETKIEELYDFIQARKCSLEEDFNSAEVPVQEKDAWMQETMEPCPSLRLHITNTCGSFGKEEFTMQTEGRTREASCHRIPHAGEHCMSTLQALEALDFSPAQVQRASDECSSIDFDVLLNFLLNNKEVEPCINDFKPPEKGPKEVLAMGTLCIGVVAEVVEVNSATEVTGEDTPSMPENTITAPLKTVSTELVVQASIGPQPEADDVLLDDWDSADLENTEPVVALGLGEPMKDHRRGKKSPLQQSHLSSTSLTSSDSQAQPKDIPKLQRPKGGDELPFEELPQGWLQETYADFKVDQTPAHDVSLLQETAFSLPLSTTSALPSQELVKEVNLGDSDSPRPIIWHHGCGIILCFLIK